MDGTSVGVGRLAIVPPRLLRTDRRRHKILPKRRPGTWKTPAPRRRGILMTRWLLLLPFAALPMLAAEPKDQKEEFFSPTQSVAMMKLPDGFRASLVAAEPTF